MEILRILNWPTSHSHKKSEASQYLEDLEKLARFVAHSLVRAYARDNRTLPVKLLIIGSDSAWDGPFTKQKGWWATIDDVHEAVCYQIDYPPDNRYELYPEVSQMTPGV
jgi:hypothetical protein